METKHTPGPWQIRQPEGDGTAHIIWRNDEGPGFAGETNTNHRIIARHVHSAANAALIAAAPDLLKSLERWQTFARDNGWTDADYQSGGIGWITEMNAAIAKAGGR